MKDKYVLVRKEKYDELVRASTEVKYLRENKIKLYWYMYRIIGEYENGRKFDPILAYEALELIDINREDFKLF